MSSTEPEIEGKKEDTYSITLERYINEHILATKNVKNAIQKSLDKNGMAIKDVYIKHLRDIEIINDDLILRVSDLRAIFKK